MFHKDTLRLIKKTFKRFLTILLMVLIGVSFMVGLLATKPIMHKSVDIYYDEKNFMDVQLFSSYGFNEEDVEYLKNQEIIEDVFASRFVDVYGKLDDQVYVTRVQELNSDINQFELISGRMPENEKEALTLGSSSFGTVFEEGETVQLYLEESELKDSLEYEEYTIVGTVRTPQHMSSSKETSTLENLALEAVIFVDNEDLKGEYYTSVYLTLAGAKDYVSFSDEYKDFIEDKKIELEEIASKQENYQKEVIIQKIEEEIQKGEKELEDKIGDAQKEIDKGFSELNKAYKQIQDGEKEIKENEQKLIDGEKEINENFALLEKNQKELNDAKAMIEETTGSSFEEALSQAQQLNSIYTTLEIIKEEVKGEQTVSEVINQNKEEITQLENDNKKLELEKIGLTLLGKLEEVEKIDNQIQSNKNKINELKLENTFLQGILKLYENSPIDTILNILDRMSNGSVKESYAQLLQLQDGEKQLKEGLKQLEQAKLELEDGKRQLEEGKKELEKGKNEYYKGLNELKKAQATLDEENEKARIELDKAKQDLEEMPEAGWMILDRDSHYSTAMYDGNATQMGKIGAVFPMLFFLVAALVCMTTMKRLVDEERGQIGVFSALGFSKNKIISKYVIYALLASVIGSLIGVGSGIPIFPNVIYFCWKLMYDLPEAYLYLPMSSAIIGCLSFTVLMVVVTYCVARSSLKEMPSQLMRPKAPKKAKKVFLENIPFIWNRLSFTSKVTARNLIRYKSRFFMTVVGVAGCTSLLVLGFGIKDSISQIIDIQYGEVFLYKNTVTLEDHTFTEDIRDELEKDSNIEVVVPIMSYSTKVYLEEDKAISTYIMDENEYKDVLHLKERKSQKELELNNGVVISEKFAKLYDIQVGDIIKIESSNEIKKDVEVIGICEMYFQHYLFMSKEYYEDIFNETVRYNQLAVIPNDIDAFVHDYENSEGVKNITDFEAMKGMFKTMIDALDIIVVVILIASGSLAFVVLVNLTEVNISERIREIATLKVLGFNDSEVNSYIFKEIFLLTIIGAIIGLPLAKLELGYVMSIIDMEITMFGNDIELLSYIYGFMITMVFAVLVALFMRKSLKNVQMVESLKSVE